MAPGTRRFRIGGGNKPLGDLVRPSRCLEGGILAGTADAIVRIHSRGRVAAPEVSATRLRAGQPHEQEAKLLRPSAAAPNFRLVAGQGMIAPATAGGISPTFGPVPAPASDDLDDLFETFGGVLTS